jgi:hypothetical protein
LFCFFIHWWFSLVSFRFCCVSFRSVSFLLVSCHFCFVSCFAITQIISIYLIVGSKFYGRSPLRNTCVANDHGCVQYVVIIIRSFPHSWLITGFVTTGTSCWTGTVYHSVALPVFNWFRVARCLVLCVMCCRSFSFGHCNVCPPNYDFWLPLWYLQAFLNLVIEFIHIVMQHLVPDDMLICINVILITNFRFALCCQQHCIHWSCVIYFLNGLDRNTR